MKPGTVPAGRPRRRRWAWAIVAALAALVALIALDRARPRAVAVDLVAEFPKAELRSDVLALPLLARRPEFGGRGFAPWEPTREGGLVWIEARTARLRLPLHTASEKALEIVARSHPDLGPSLSVEVLLNDVRVGTLRLTPESEAHRLVLPAALQSPGENVLKLVSPRQREPAPGERDRRTLVAAISGLVVNPLGSDGRPALPTRDASDLVLPPLSSIAFHVRLPPSARFDAILAGSGSADRFEVTAEDDRGAHAVVAGFPSDPRVRADLGALAHRIVRLRIANESARGLVRLRGACVSVPPTAPVARAAPPGVRPDLVVFLTDTLRADHLGAYGHAAPTSPRLDAFAREAIVFDDAWAQASWTRSAVASIFTGRHVAAHGVDREDRALAPAATTLAEALREAGYRTGAFVGNHLLGGRFAFDQGFQSWNDGEDALYGAPAAELVARALRWLDGAPGPSLLYIHTMEPHAPYTPDPEHAAPFAVPGYAGSTDTVALLRAGQLGELGDAERRFLLARYQGEVRQNDAAFGALVEGLRAGGRLPGAVVAFTADHGEELLEHGGTGHGKTLYQEQLRIPLVVRLPGGARAGAREAAPVEQIDLAPTLLALAGVAAPREVAGRDLSTSWRTGAPAAVPLLFAEQRFEVVDKYAVRADAAKLVLNNDGRALWRAGAHVELYDLAADPRETQNLAAARPVTVAYLRQELESYRARTVGTPASALLLSPQEREQLRALGYAAQP